MSKILKLTGLASYVAACTNGIVIKRGQSAKFDNNHADALLRGARKDKEGEDLPYFKELSGDEKVDFDFSTQVTKQRDRETAEGLEDAPVKAVVPRQRKAPATHAAV